MTTEERVIQPDDSDSDDEVARLVRLAGPTGSTVPIAAERLARVRTAVHGAWLDDYVVRTRRRRPRKKRLARATPWPGRCAPPVPVPA